MMMLFKDEKPGCHWTDVINASGWLWKLLRYAREKFWVYCMDPETYSALYSSVTLVNELLQDQRKLGRIGVHLGHIPVGPGLKDLFLDKGIGQGG